MLAAAQAGANLYIMDGSGLHFIMSGAGIYDSRHSHQSFCSG